VEGRLAEEVRFHVEMATAKNLAKGMRPDEARRAALIAFGGAEQWKDATRDAYRTRVFDEILQDTRHAVRALRAAPSYSLAALLTLTLGIGATTAIFSVVNAVLLRDLPYPRPERLVVLCERKLAPEAPPCNSVNPGNFIAWQEEARSFSGMAAFVDARVSISGGRAEPVVVNARLATASIFGLLAAGSAEGRLFTSNDDRPDAPAVVVLSSAFWRSHFGGNRELIGGSLLIDGRPFTVIGVTSPGFGISTPVDLWVPMRFTAQHRIIGGRYLRAVARLKDGVTRDQANREMVTLAASRAEAFPANNANWTVLTLPLADYLTGTSRAALLMILGMVGFLLLLACANIANLTLARALDREREVAVRSSLGASPGRIVRQLLTESLVLCLTAAALGLALAAQGVRALVALVPSGVLALSTAPVRVDWRVALFAALTALGTAFLVGLVPAIQAGRAGGSEALRAGGRGNATASRAGARMRNALVVIEVALALVLLVGAGLMVRSFRALRGVNLGFEPERVLTGRVALPRSGYPNDTVQQNFFREVGERVAALPGVSSVGWISFLPLTGQRASNGFNLDDRPPAPLGAEPVGEMHAITPGYLAAMGIPLVEGRPLSEHDRAETPAVALVSQSLAKRFWPNGSALGHHLLYEWFTNQRAEIVGVVGDVRHDGPATAPLLDIYRPLTQFPYPAMSLVVRGTGDLLGYASSVRTLVREIDSELPLADVQPMTALVNTAVGSTRLITTLLVLFGGLGMALAAVGIYGLMAYTVQLRRQEFGVRLALGGRPGALVTATVRRGMLLTLRGIGVGLVAAILTARLMNQLLFEVTPADRITFGVTVTLLAVVGLLAAWIPARRAARIDLLALLRGS
jgi:putative ABC transport system permease protein